VRPRVSLARGEKNKSLPVDLQRYICREEEEASFVPSLPLLTPCGPSLDHYRTRSIAISLFLTLHTHTYTLSLSFSYLMLEYRFLQFLLHGDDLLVQTLGYFHASRQVVSTSVLRSRRQPWQRQPRSVCVCVCIYIYMFPTRREAGANAAGANWQRSSRSRGLRVTTSDDDDGDEDDARTSGNGGGSPRRVLNVTSRLVSSRLVCVRPSVRPSVRSELLRTSAVSSLRCRPRNVACASSRTRH